jgi:tripartite-type tricarboxylate transporter receptor subunit TctC
VKVKIALLVGLSAICFSPIVLSQSFPSAPVRFIVPLAQGGGVDAIVRLVTPKLAETWGQTVTVENLTAGGGTEGTALVAKSPADGHTLVGNSNAHVVSASLRRNLPYDPLKDFVPVTFLTGQSYVLVVGNVSSIRSVRDLIANAKAKPGELKFTSAGVGSGTHLMAEKFNVDAGIKMVHLPTAGAKAANEEVAAGRITYWFSSLTPAMPFIRDGQLVALGVSGPKRLATMPDLPTVAEAGVPGYESTLWYGIWAPSSTPGQVIDRIARDVANVLSSSDTRAQLAKLNAEVRTMSAAEFARFVQAEAESVAKTVKAAGISPQ